MYKGFGILSHLLTETKLVHFYSILKKQCGVAGGVQAAPLDPQLANMSFKSIE